jgi:hypothetical protein
MALQVKYSNETAVPTSLANGEPAYTTNGEILFVGSNNVVLAVGGKRTPGTLTANQAITVDANSFVDVVKVGGLMLTTSGTTNTTVSTLSSNLSALANSTSIATALALKTYVDENAVTGGSTTLNGMTDVTIADRTTSDFLMASNTTHVRNVTVEGGVTAVANDTVVTFDVANSSANFAAGANLSFTTALKDGSGNRLQILFANGDAAWG